MYNYNSPRIVVPENPVGVDRAVWDLQALLVDELLWLETCFGRATMQIGELNAKEVTDKRLKNIFYFPEVWQKGEPFNCFSNDNLKAQAWFFARDPLKFPDYNLADQVIKATAALSIYFWCNLSKIDPEAITDGNFMEELRTDSIQALWKNKNWILRESYTSHTEVFQPFTITTEFRELLKPPFVAWRLDGDYTFDYQNCL